MRYLISGLVIILASCKSETEPLSNIPYGVYSVSDDRGEVTIDIYKDSLIWDEGEELLGKTTFKIKRAGDTIVWTKDNSPLVYGIKKNELIFGADMTTYKKQ